MRSSPARVGALALFAALILVPLAQVAAEGLKDDGRVGAVIDRQGLVFVRAAGRTRWTPLAQRDLVYPGDRIRTETRGPNALDVRLKGGARLTVGPGALLDVTDATSFALLEGEMEAVGTEQAPLHVTFGGGKGYEIKETRWLKHRQGQVETLKEAPRWLTGYRSGTSEEWMGSLVVTLDGKEVPLHVGWHKVDVEVRDQVARTTIEQTFVNETNTRLEGVFRFPLPAEASISGFGMWIGSELVEADIVERERARQIYEDILRRKKDPGLLEWAGGNVFQARVFPIEPHSEKRVRLRYTEVLPLEQGVWRYRYALRSELLKLKPLKELQLAVRVLSTQALESVACTTHPDATVSADAHTAQVELTQRDVSPQSDFEVAGRVAAGGGVTVVTHRRGEDGWFMVLVRPPEPEGQGWQRELVPDGGPLDLLLAVDTSGSIDPASRKAQLTFLTALLGLLAPEDKVRVCTLDTVVRWMDEKPTAAGPGLGEKVLGFLDARAPRGWSDLDQGFEQVIAKTTAGTQVIYLGDGIATSGDGDPAALAQRLRAASARTKATFHAVVPGATYERLVLEALASLGGGSVRPLREDPAGVAQRLLTEMAQPGLKDLKVEIQGVPTARVYPEKLANLPPGGQHVVLGRLLPSGATAQATVSVSGSYDGRPVRFTAPITLLGNEEGNSFLPRLWARRHLDVLLEQGPSAEVKAEIVRFSTEHTILTPYSSLLVLESDEDRERYGVERRVKARDGEVEFAATRDRAALEASKRAIENAQAWRLHLRRVIQQEIAGLGRDLPIPVPEVALGEWFGGSMVPRAAAGVWGGDEVSGFGFTSYGQSVFTDKDGDTYNTDRIPPFGGSSYEESLGALHLMDTGVEIRGLALPAAAAPMSPAAPAPSPAMAPPGGPRSGDKSCGSAGKSCGAEPKEETESLRAKNVEGQSESGDDEGGFDDADEEEAGESDGKDARAEGKKVLRSRGGGAGGYFRGPHGMPSLQASASSGFGLPWNELAEGTRRGRADATLLGFPGAGSPAYDRPPEPEPPLATSEARRLLDLLLKPARELEALRVTERGERFHPSRGTSQASWSRLILRSADTWFLRRGISVAPSLERSLQGQTVTTLDTGTRLARAWDAGPEARASLTDIRRALGLPDARALEGAVVAEGDSEEAGSTTLVITRPPAREAVVWTVRESDGALLEQTQMFPGRPYGKRVYSAHVELGGLPWPTVVEDFDEQGRRLERVELKVEALDASAYAAAFAEAHHGREDVIVLGPTAPTLREARAALAQNKAGLEERIVLTLDRLAAGRPDEAWSHFDAALAPHAGKPGAAWLRAVLLEQTRKRAELKRHLEDVLGPGIAARPMGRWALSERGLALAEGVLGAAEVLDLHGRWTDMATDAGKLAEAHWSWRWRRVGFLGAAGRTVEARALVAALAAERPHDLAAQMHHAQALVQTGEPEQAVDHVTRVLADGPWLEYERDALELVRSDWRWERLRYEPLLAELAAWAQACPASSEPWVRRASLLYVLGRAEEADASVKATLTGVGRGATSTQAERTQIAAAIQLALGQGWNIWSQEFAPLFQDDLIAALRFHLGQDDDRRGLAGQILEDWRMGQLAATRALKQELRAQAAQPGSLSTWDHQRLATQLQLLGWNKDTADEAVYLAVQTGLEARRAAAATFGEREAWAGLVAGLAGQREDQERVLGVRRREREAATGRARLSATTTLLSALLAAKHGPALEEEAYPLIVELAQSSEPEARRLGRAGTHLRQLVAWALPARAEALLGTPEERAKRTRVEARAVERESRLKARAALAEKLAQPGWPEAAAPWAALERLALLSENRESLEAVADGALALLEPRPGRFAALPREHPLAQVGRVIEARAAWLLTHAATRRGAPETIAARALQAFEARWELERHDWRYETFRLLVALDRVQDLGGALATWVGPDDIQARWKRAQGYLAAELGRPAEAAALFESLRGLEGVLSPADFEVLTTWHLVAGDAARREAAVVARFEAMGEWDLRNWLQVLRRGTAGPGGVPGDLSPETFPALTALMRKAPHPANHLWVVQNLYQGTKDHRILAALAEGVVGHSAQSVYAYLEQVGQQIDQVHEEAALDALRQAADASRMRATSLLDKRGMALLIARIEARAAIVLLKDPRHAGRAVEALKSAATELEHGEIRYLANYLGQLTAGTDAALSAERARQLSELAKVADAPSGDRLHVQKVLATLHWSERRYDAALDVLAAALTEAKAQTDPRARSELHATLELRIGWLAERGLFQQAEALVEASQREASSTVERERWVARLAALWAQGLAKKGTFRIGRGEALYRAALTSIEQAWRTLPTLQDELHQSHAALAAAAHDTRVVSDVGGERVRFAKERLPALLVGYPGPVTERIEFEAQTLDKLAGPRAALAFALDRMDAEPAWVARLDQDVWTQSEWQLAERRRRAEPLGDVGPRLLARVKAALTGRVARESLQVSGFWSTGNQNFWATAVPDMLAAALAAAEGAPAAPGVQRACAHHLRTMGRTPEAIGVLTAADKRGHLDDAGRHLLLGLLLGTQDFTSALALVDRLLQVTPESLALHKHRAQALMGLSRPADAEAALRTGLEHAAGAKPPGAGLLADVGQAAENMGLHAVAAGWLKDALTQAEQSGQLRHAWMDWRRSLAEALASLDRIDEAMDVAAVVAVGQRGGHHDQIGPIDDSAMPERVLLRAKDLAGYVTRFEAQVAKTGADVPVVRKALARVFRSRKDAAQAIHHLEALRAVVPDDLVVLRALVELYDETGKPEEARLALDRLVGHDPGNAAAWEDLGRRLLRAGAPEEAERAFTNAVEMRPLEPDGYRLLARLAAEAKQQAVAARHWHNVTRVRPIEPEGRLEEAKAWIAAGDPAKARPLLDEVLAGTWEERFGPVKEEAGRLLQGNR